MRFIVDNVRLMMGYILSVWAGDCTRDEQNIYLYIYIFTGMQTTWR